MALKNSQHDAIMRMYHQKQLNTIHKMDKRYEEVSRKCPEIKEIDDAISSVSVDQAKRILSGDDAAMESLREQLQALSGMRRKLLTEHGYPEDYLEPQYDCSHCKDTGYIDNVKCRCFKKAAADMLYMQSNISDILQTENFDQCSLDYYSSSYIDKTTGLSSLDIARNALNVCKEFIRSFDSSFENIFFYGDTGIGKTFLSNCIAKELIDSAHSVIYITAFQLFDTFAKNKFSNDRDSSLAYEYIFDCDLLIIDDLGTELTNSFVSSELFLCLNERILRKKSTIISTNLSLETMVNTYSERTFSRISSNYKMIKLVGDDIRIKKKLSGR